MVQGLPVNSIDSLERYLSKNVKEVRSAVEERIWNRFDDENEVQNTFSMNKYIPAYNMVVETMSNTELFGKLCFLRILYLILTEFNHVLPNKDVWFLPYRSLQLIVVNHCRS